MNHITDSYVHSTGAAVPTSTASLLANTTFHVEGVIFPAGKMFKLKDPLQEIMGRVDRQRMPIRAVKQK